MTILLRRHVILLNFDLLRVIILWDRIIVIVPVSRQTPHTYGVASTRVP